MIDTIWYKGRAYPEFQTVGNAAKFAIPYARQVCKGHGYDVGCGKVEWSLPGSDPVDLSFEDGWDANNLPPEEPDYIFSSHCLEHISDWVATMDYWHERLKEHGTLFLYLPDFSQQYWRPWNNRKHQHAFTPEIIRAYMEEKYVKVFVSGVDLNNSFMVMGEKYAYDKYNIR